MCFQYFINLINSFFDKFKSKKKPDIEEKEIKEYVTIIKNIDKTFNLKGLSAVSMFLNSLVANYF
ncbi:hypothetical protein A3Q56_00093 [Intoshia linei]|uniref:Uncharacterized protein n=1 Tax=Intoshia linei TaxID=1819745 RepID=A0A177BF03_9BILA|nr:hypothetical protein A3Q56_00093 [Intoshia linei]